MDGSTQMLTFVKVVELGSISAASRDSGLTPSAVSKQIGHLEDHVGQRLLYRKRTGVTLTQEGQSFYDKCRAVADKFYEAEAHISTYRAAPSGPLRVASSVAFGKYQLIGALPDFLAAYPDIRVSLELTDRVIDLEEESFDVAITFAEQMTNQTVVARKIMGNERILVASPAFIARHGMPETFEDLARFNCLRTTQTQQRNAWEARFGDTTHRVDATGSFEGNSADAVFQAALAGMGIARLSTYIVADKIASGALIQLFPAYTQQRADVAVTFADKRNLAPRIRAFVDFLAERFRKSG